MVIPLPVSLPVECCALTDSTHYLITKIVMMNTRPDPLKLFIVSGPKQKTFHLGFYVPNRTRPKALCRALPWNVLEAIVVKDEGEANCYRCHKKLESIFRAIKRLGHEWICYAHYLPMEERTFEVPLNPKITINPR